MRRSKQLRAQLRKHCNLTNLQSHTKTLNQAAERLIKPLAADKLPPAGRRRGLYFPEWDIAVQILWQAVRRVSH